MNEVPTTIASAPNFVQPESAALWRSYLARVETLTKPLALPQQRDIAAEVRAHLLESMLEGEGSESERLGDAQRRLGAPEDFVPGWVQERLNHSADPGLMLRSRWQLMRLDFAQGLLGLLRSVLFGFGHMIVFYSYSLVILKLIYPENVGLYTFANGVPILGFVDVDGLTEHLGWTLIPAMLVIGTGLFWLMNRPSKDRRSNT